MERRTSVLVAVALLLGAVVFLMTARSETPPPGPRIAAPSPSATSDAGGSPKAVARAREVAGTLPDDGRMEFTRVKVEGALPAGWGQAAPGASVFAAEGGHELVAPSVSVVRLELPANGTIEGLGHKYRGHTDDLGVTYGAQRPALALGGAALVVEGHGSAGGTGYVLDRVFVRDGTVWYSAVVTMVDSDVATYRAAAHRLLRDQIRIDVAAAP